MHTFPNTPEQQAEAVRRFDDYMEAVIFGDIEEDPITALQLENAIDPNW